MLYNQRLNMKSMTGYGHGECAEDGFKITVEISSVNRKQSDVSVSLSRELEPLESQVRDEINRRVVRGRLNVRIVLHAAVDGPVRGKIQANLGLAKAYLSEMTRLAKALGIAPTINLDQLLRVPGIIQVVDGEQDAETHWPATQKALRQALAGLIAMREREGANLSKDLVARIKIIQRSVARIKKQTPLVVKHFSLRLRERLKNAGVSMTLAEDPRLLQEVALFADRADISEEVARLESHFQQFEDCLKSKEAVGRTLDFLAQEMFREVNTLGSKANDSRISREVVVLKAELEKFREQAQNVE